MSSSERPDNVVIPFAQKAENRSTAEAKDLSLRIVLDRARDVIRRRSPDGKPLPETDLEGLRLAILKMDAS
jgi:hypothetical protein